LIEKAGIKDFEKAKVISSKAILRLPPSPSVCQACPDWGLPGKATRLEG
jgi:hypothetical protein